jgi:hypothetical protein
MPRATGRNRRDYRIVVLASRMVPVELLNPCLGVLITWACVRQRLLYTSGQFVCCRASDIPQLGARYKMTGQVIGVGCCHDPGPASERFKSRDPEPLTQRGEHEHARCLHQSEHFAVIFNVRAKRHHVSEPRLHYMSL